MKLSTFTSHIFVALATVCLLLMTSPAQAKTVETEEWEITADKITRYENPTVIIAEGNVILEKKAYITSPKNKTNSSSSWSDLTGFSHKKQDNTKQETETTQKTITTIKADWIAYDVDMASIKAKGGIFIDTGADQLTAESGEVNLNKETGTFTNATIIREYKDIHMEGKVIRKTGALTYQIEDGWIISCKLEENETPPWSFASQKADITDGGYAHLRNASFRIKDIPVLYTPYMILPVKRSRQTGFLFPELSYSNRDGFGLLTPFFINLSPSADITLYPQYLSERGFMAGAEARYALAPESLGFFMANYLNDNLSDINDPDNADYFKDGGYTHTNQERYWIRGKANHNIGYWTSRLDIDIVSDKDYLSEFYNGFTGFKKSNERFIETFGRGFQNQDITDRYNSIGALRYWENGSSLQISLLGINDVRDEQAINPSTTTFVRDPLWHLPQINYSGAVPVYNTGADFSWDSSYTNFWREKGVRGQRLDLPARLSRGIPLSPYLETTVEGGIRYTGYIVDGNDDPLWTDDDNINRLLTDIGGRMGTTMARDFAINHSEYNAINHKFRPYIAYSYLVDLSDTTVPQFDSIDAISEQNLFYYGLDNYFKYTAVNGKERDLGYLKVKHGYDFRDELSDTPFIPVELKAALYPLQRLLLSYTADIDLYGDGIIKQTAGTYYTTNRGDQFYLDYFFRKESTESIKGGFNIILPYSWRITYDIERSIKESQTLRDDLSLIYTANCWDVTFSTSSTPDDRSYMVFFTLANLGSPFGVKL